MFGWISVIVQIAVLSSAFYFVLLFFRGTRGAQVLLGLALVLFALIGLSQAFRLDELNWLLSRFSVYLAIAFLIVFQPEIRRALAELGRQPALAGGTDRRSVVDHVVEAVEMLAEHRIGALIAVERDIGTRAVQDTGVRLDARLVPELLASIFFPHAPLHDGGVIISGDRIQAAGCVFPLSQRVDLLKTLGTRHRAAVGLSEETDAVVIVVSEETGTISVGYRGRLNGGLDATRLHRFLSALLLRRTERRTLWQLIQRRPVPAPGGLPGGPRAAEGEASHG